ncbi:2OG-Fe(II) oxygenase [Lysobacter sp. 5GHs7-4]|uniref:prolyl hydroxylase family protein n=1 Tax=Lysobacter sp. 5GHs7-4 TaxID=2904253 RepID=UPI001E426C16|nr:2OG-Fe(II) oxygenase [Lysobacter sp. 5GHs7-4]UHQ24906.1 2OG-Fe(II) oxygenase [Lysobacter sp. 5GHs7-4]
MRLTAHSERAFTVGGLFGADECAQLIALAEARGFEPAGVRTTAGQKAMPHVRNNERVVLESPEWVDRLWRRLSGLALPVLDGQVARGLPRSLRFYKYGPGQRFRMHKDGPWTEDGMSSRLTLLVYLNEGFVGGDTDFRDFRIAPVAGEALLFVHDTWHEGAAVEQGVKYVLRSDVLYGAAP